MSFSLQNNKFSESIKNISCTDHEILTLGQGTPLIQEDFKSVLEIFENLADSCGNDIAVISNGNIITYEELNYWASRVSEDLQAMGMGQGKRIAIIIEPSILMVVAVLASLKAGATYIPFDYKQPLNRIKLLLKDSNTSGIITNQNSFDYKNKLEQPVYQLNNLLEQSKPLLPQKIKKNGLPLHNQIAYIIYTSGSTGEPKGVLVGHQQLSNSTLARRMTYSGKHTFLLVSPLSSDSSMAGLWGTLTSGGKLVVASYMESRDPERLIELIKEHNVTQTLCVPSLYEAVLNVIEKNKIAYPNCLNTVILAGENLRQSLVDKHFSLAGKSATLFNEYGPTEATIWATYKRFNSPEPVSIGGPIPGTSLYVLDESFNLIPSGDIGELFIGGDQVTEGYLNRPEETSKTFFPDPYNTSKKAFMYKTGDLVRWNTEGALEFIGRKDQQVKIRGHRVELGAIETVLCSFPEVRDAVVVLKSEDTTLVAFVVAPAECSLDNLKQKLTNELPSFMIPTRIIVIDSLPLTNTGKVDRLALMEMTNKKSFETHYKENEEGLGSDDDSKTITQLLSAWSEILEINSVPPNINFFDLGGHSLTVFKLQEAIERYTGIRPSIVSLFRHTTVLDQAELIKNLSSENKIIPPTYIEENAA